MNQLVTYLVMKTHDRLTLKQAEALLAALETVDPEQLFTYQEKANFKTAVSKLNEAVQDAMYREGIRQERRAKITHHRRPK